MRLVVTGDRHVPDPSRKECHDHPRHRSQRTPRPSRRGGPARARNAARPTSSPPPATPSRSRTWPTSVSRAARRLRRAGLARRRPSPGSTGCSSSRAARSVSESTQHRNVIDAVRSGGGRFRRLHEHHPRRHLRPRARRRAPRDRAAARRLRGADRAAAQLVVRRELHRAAGQRARARCRAGRRGRGSRQRRHPRPTTPRPPPWCWPVPVTREPSTSSAPTTRSRSTQYAADGLAGRWS